MKRTLYFGGPILTMDKEHPTAEAILTENGRILAAGSLKKMKNIDAVPVNLNGRTMMPGFVDGHSHLISTGMNLTKYCSLEGCESFEELLDRIKTFVREKDLTHGESIVCKGYDLATLKERRHPTATLLDTLGLDNPITCIHISEHVATYNTPAMRKAGIREDTYVCPPGGFAGRDAEGKLNGYFEETARSAFSSVFAANSSPEEIETAVLAAQDYYIQHGYTTIQEGSANNSARLGYLERLSDERKFKVDVVAYMSANPAAVPTWKNPLEHNGRSYKNRLKIGGVKMYLDGSPQVRTAWMREPYEGEAQYRGYPTLTDAQVEERLRNAMEYNLQPLAHCNGDAASEQFIKAWEKVSSKIDSTNLRPVMIHAQTVGYDQLDRMAHTGMMASFFIGHCYFWGDTHLQNLGKRALHISPVKQAQNIGVPFSFHQDCPVTKPNMIHSVWCAVNRLTRNGVCLGDDNRISCYDALVAATNGGAYGYFEENTKGILKSGAIADFVILDLDPTAVDSKNIKNIRVLCTIKEDEVIYRAE